MFHQIKTAAVRSNDTLLGDAIGGVALMVTLVVDEAPADFEIQLDVVGLPQFDAIIKHVNLFQLGDIANIDEGVEFTVKLSDFQRQIGTASN